VPPTPVDANSVFLNIPYDDEFRELYLAYIVGLYQLGLVPRLASGIQGGERRLDRILALIKTCRYSIHDLSRVELSVPPPETPRFNMPLELGLAIAWTHQNPKRHTWFVWESSPFRIQKSTSDLNGTDPNIHHGTVEGVLSELRCAFVLRDSPSVQRMTKAFELVKVKVNKILSSAGTTDVFSASAFKALCFVALNAASNVTSKRRP